MTTSWTEHPMTIIPILNVDVVASSADAHLDRDEMSKLLHSEVNKGQF